MVQVTFEETEYMDHKMLKHMLSDVYIIIFQNCINHINQQQQFSSRFFSYLFFSFSPFKVSISDASRIFLSCHFFKDVGR